MQNAIVMFNLNLKLVRLGTVIHFFKVIYFSKFSRNFFRCTQYDIETSYLKFNQTNII